MNIVSSRVPWRRVVYALGLVITVSSVLFVVYQIYDDRNWKGG